MRLSKRLRWRFGFLRVVHAQLRTGRPPAVRATYGRLRTKGLPALRAYRLLAAAYEAEVAAMILEERVYDHAAYLRRLVELPASPTVSFDAVPPRWSAQRSVAADPVPEHPVARPPTGVSLLLNERLDHRVAECWALGAHAQVTLGLFYSLDPHVQKGTARQASDQ